LGGEGTREQVLNHIKTCNYLDLKDEDKEYTPKSCIPRWETNLAFFVSDLKTSGFISDTAPTGIWRITNFGETVLLTGCFLLLTEFDDNVWAPMLLKNVYKKAKNYVISQRHKMNTEKYLQVMKPQLIEKIDKL